MGVDGEIHSVTIGDLSGFGALVVMAVPPEQGDIGDLWIAGFGDVEDQDDVLRRRHVRRDVHPSRRASRPAAEMADPGAGWDKPAP